MSFGVAVVLVPQFGAASKDLLLKLLRGSTNFGWWVWLFGDFFNSWWMVSRF